jgi:hypothetical protein
MEPLSPMMEVLVEIYKMKVLGLDATLGQLQKRLPHLRGTNRVRIPNGPYSMLYSPGP